MKEIKVNILFLTFPPKHLSSAVLAPSLSAQTVAPAGVMKLPGRCAETVKMREVLKVSTHIQKTVNSVFLIPTATLHASPLGHLSLSHMIHC